VTQPEERQRWAEDLAAHASEPHEELTDEQVAALVTRPDMPVLTKTMINLAKRQRHIE